MKGIINNNYDCYTNDQIQTIKKFTSKVAGLVEATYSNNPNIKHEYIPQGGVIFAKSSLGEVETECFEVHVGIYSGQ